MKIHFANSLIPSILFICFLSEQANSLIKNKYCDCRPFADNIENDEVNINSNNLNFVNYIVSLGKLTWSLEFFTDKHKVETHLCSGVILNENYVLSTASCLTTETNYKKVGVGLNSKQNDLIAIYDDGRMPIKRRILHEHFNSTTLENDIAIVELKEPIDFRKTKYRPICLFEKSKCWFNKMNSFNWGNLRDLKDREVKATDLKYLRYLKTTNLEDISYHVPDCINHPTNTMCMRLIDRMNSDSENSICRHDHGSPLLFNEDGKVSVIGLFSHYSFDDRDSNNCQSIGVYTKISQYIQWAKSHIEDEFCYF